MEPYYHDELGLLALIDSLEQTFDIEIDDDDLTEGACGTVQQLAALIRQNHPSRPNPALLEEVLAADRAALRRGCAGACVVSSMKSLLPRPGPEYACLLGLSPTTNQQVVGNSPGCERWVV